MQSTAVICISTYTVISRCQAGKSQVKQESLLNKMAYLNDGRLGVGKTSCGRPTLSDESQCAYQTGALVEWPTATCNYGQAAWLDLAT